MRRDTASVVPPAGKPHSTRAVSRLCANERPGSADAVRRALDQLHDQWRAAIAKLSDPDLGSPTRARWPFRDRPFGDVVAWANVELVKNASEIGYARFLYASREPVAAP